MRADIARLKVKQFLKVEDAFFGQGNFDFFGE